MLKENKPIIVGIEGKELSDREKQLFDKYRPLGFIVFSRNIENKEQLLNLTNSMRELLGEKIPILIDQEGGRVARLKPPIWPEFKPARYFGEIAEKDFVRGQELVYDNAVKLAKVLKNSGINVNCAPVADMIIKDAHDIIGDRAFSEDPHIVSSMARTMARAFLFEGILPIVKHIPGHGRANVDSHESLPTVTADLDTLKKVDFLPFHSLNDLPLAMTAHIIYTALDPNNPATLSKKVIDYIRNEIGFNGIILTDDINMKALKGDILDIANQSLNVGCDVILHCNGNYNEMHKLLMHLDYVNDNSLEKINHLLLNYNFL